MKTFKEYNQLDEGILDTVKNVVKSVGRGIGKTLVGAAKYTGQAVGAIPGGIIRGFKKGLGKDDHGGSGGYGMTYRRDRSNKRINQLKAELAKAKASGKSPKATGTSGTKPPSGLGPKPTTPPTGGTTKVPSPTGSAPVPPAPPTPAVPAPAAPVPAPVKTLTKAEKKDRRDAARTVGGVTSRLGKIESNPDDDTSFRAARTDPAKVKLAAKGADLEAKRAAIQTKTGKVRKGVQKSDIKKFNVSQEMTKGNILRTQSIAQNPELANKLAAARARIARTKSKSGQVMGAYESTELVNSVMKFLDK
jgi:hypothetical protein